MSTQLENLKSNPAEDNGPLMSIATWCLVGVSGAFLIVRLIIQKSQRRLWIDDLLLGLSWTLLLVQVILNQLAINLGYGRHALDVNLSNFNTMIYYGASELTISIIAITLSKISFGVTLLRLTSGWTRYYVCFAITTLAVFAIPAATVPWTQCKPIAKTFLDILPGTCVDKRPSVRYGNFQAIWSAMMDVSLALLPWKILWNVQMRTAEKIGVGLAMSLGVFAGAIAIVRAHYIEKLAVLDTSYDSYTSIIWASAEAAMAIVATSIPVLRVVLKGVVNTAIEGYNTSGRSKSRTNSSQVLSSGGWKQSSKRPTDLSVTLCGDESLMKSHGKGYLELDDLIVDEDTGRVSAATPVSISEAKEQRVPQWPL
ncbi:hypothetical protein AA0119_g1411 [Alternaria tenuissima]|uniref:Rhodopsin domain-containing protein n=1 Tax=Alternaria tenuissima TaxID=119927 RepID=A0ABY0GMP8_9PLEO|nr:hypothetical protein AA0119_g1411 [Alternaria tenuissima]RYO22035.1 hypothetical protein AA0121_g2309 [Alternaria tenuissima]RYO66177.1 hypothetical protein AA0116_g2765 [Alternaria tenuissima]